jgi:hypothetical protein
LLLGGIRLFTSTRHRLFFVVLAIVLVGTGCSDDGGAASSTSTGGVDGDDQVIFGSGELPETLPADFPLPAGSTVGSTMVVTNTGFTEVVVRIGAERGIAVSYFEQNLGQADITVDSSSAENDSWLIEFSKDDSKGTIEITEPQPGISQAVIRYNVP